MLRKKIDNICDLVGISGFLRLARLVDHNSYIFVNLPKVGGNSIRAALHRCEALKSGILNDNEKNESITRKETAVDARPNGKLFLRYPLNISNWLTIENTLKEGTVFTFVRNPYTRLISGYKEKVIQTFSMLEEYKNTSEPDPMFSRRIKRRISRIKELGLSIEQMPSFEQFIVGVTSIPVEKTDIHFAPQSYLTAFNVIPYDFIGRLEAYDEDMDQLSNILFGEANFWRLAEQLDGGQRNVNYKGGGSKNNLLNECTSRTVELIKMHYKQDFENFGYSTRLEDADTQPKATPPTRNKLVVNWAKIAFTARMAGLTYKAEKNVQNLISHIRQK